MRKINYLAQCSSETNADQVRCHRSNPVNYLEFPIDIKSLER